jgi:hypothetical protein
MHAEITNTPLSNILLNQCQMCQLSVMDQEEKHSKCYLHNFLHLDQDGEKVLNPLWVWRKTIEDTYKLFDVGFYSTLKEHKRLGKSFGVKDCINGKFFKSKTNTLVQSKVKSLLLEDSTQLFNPFLKLKGIGWLILNQTTR